jgi:hypothetical protein
MARRLLAWLLVTPLAAAGVLVGHALAYALTATDPGPEHDYLAHVPQVVGLLASIALAGLALQDRSVRPRSTWWFVPMAPLGFAVQEHLERFVHTGHVPWLLTSSTFLVGLALQLPVAAACAVLVRFVLGSASSASRRRVPPAPHGAWLPLPAHPRRTVRRVDLPRRGGRAPPALLAS